MMEISEDKRLAIKRGAYWLDENYPGWETKLDLNKLEMNNCNQCVIGQAVGEFWTTVQKVTGSISAGEEWGIEHGFTTKDACDLASSAREWKQLEIGWTEVVNDRLGRI